MLALYDGIGCPSIPRGCGGHGSLKGFQMRFSEPVRMADDQAGPVWARTKRRSRGGGGFVGLIVTLLALFGVLTAALGIKEQSLAGGGALVDGWITAGIGQARKLAGQAPEAAEAGVETAGEAAGKTGDALQAGAAATAQELKGP